MSLLDRITQCEQQIAAMQQELRTLRELAEQAASTEAGDPLAQPDTSSVANSQVLGSSENDLNSASDLASNELASVEQVDESESPEDSTENPLIAELCQHLASVAELIAQRKIGLDPSKTAFLSKVQPVLESAQGDDRIARLVDVVRFIDALGASALGKVFAPLHDLLSRARVLVDRAFEGQASLIQVTEVNQDSSVGTVRQLPVHRPMILESGVRRPSGDVAVAPVSVIPEPGPSIDRVHAWNLVEELYQQQLKHFHGDCQTAITKLLGQLGNGESIPQGYWQTVLNIHTRWTAKSDTPAVKTVVQYLRESYQWSPFIIPTGERYDPAKHDAKRYDHVDVSNEAPSGTVIGIRQLGLAGADGLPIQPCVVICSA